jgi:hypothetical protein
MANREESCALQKGVEAQERPRVVGLRDEEKGVE